MGNVVLELVPGEAFYRTFDDAQVCDIVDHLERHREVPRQYNYFGEGAQGWDRFATGALDGATSGFARVGVELMAGATQYVLACRAPAQQVDVLDIGPGNALPVRGMLRTLLDQGALGRYVAVDISPDMLAVAERNIAAWFGDHVQFEGHLADLSRPGSGNPGEFAGLGRDGVVHVVLLLDGLLANVRYPAEALRAVRDWMNDCSLLICTNGLDTPRTRELSPFAARLVLVHGQSCHRTMVQSSN
jgi:SAM-dependent methyltransferase